MQISSYEKCIFYDKPIASILKSLDYNGSVLNSGGSYSVSLNLSQITSKIEADAQIGVWKPIVIGKNASYSASSNLPYFQGSMPSWEDQPQHSLGQEAFIVINNLNSAAFHDLNITGYDNTSNSNINAYIDWFIADVNALDCYPDNGILCWYKNVNDIVQQQLSKYTSGKILQTSSVLYDTNSKILLPSNIYLKKIDNDKFEVQPDNGSVKGFANLLNAQDLSKIKHNIDLTNENNVFSPLVVEIKNLLLNNATGPYLLDNPNHLFTDVNKISRFLNYNNSYYDLFISDGDTFSYTVRGDSESYHFVSYKIETNFRLWYSTISNMIPNYSTLNELSRSNLKKYCMYLASAPETDRVTKSISGYGWLNNLLPLLNTDFSISNFLILSNYIYTEYNIFSKSFRQNIFKPTQNINDCNINQYIFYRLLHKYDMYLSVNGGESKGFEINKPLLNEYINGPNIRVDLNFVSYGKPSQGTYARSGKTPFAEAYNQYVQAGPLKVKTIIEGNSSSENYPIISFDALSANGSSSVNKAGGMDGYADAYEKLERDPTPNTELLIRPEIKSVGFYKQGGIKIYSSGCHIDEDVGRNALATGSLDGKPVFFDFDTMSSIGWEKDSRGNYVYNVVSPDASILKTIRFGFSVGSNAGYIKLYRISAFWLRYDNYRLCSCDSFYEEKLNFTKEYARSTSTNVPFMGDIYGADLPRRIGYVRGGYCDSTTIGKELTDGSNEITIPGVTNHFAPRMLAYGGYEPKDIAKLGLDIPNHPSVGQFMPLLFERNENYSEDMKCYMRTGWILDENITSDTTPLIHSDYIAQKGVFHPFIGWIPFTSSLYSSFNNKTFVNIDNWSAANRLKFQGAGFLFDSRGSGYQKYTSRLYIKKGEAVGDSDIYSRTTGRRDINFRMNGMTMRHSLELCIPKKIPEDDISPTNQPIDCVGYNPLAYSYLDSSATAEDIFQPVADYSLYTGDGNSNTDNVYIGDISLKLNFLNYVNPKDLKITLLTNFTSDTSADISSYANLINSGSDIDNDLKIYLQKLEEQNPYNSIVLFNRETIQNYDRDFCITFSDYAPIHNQLSDLNNHLPHMPYSSWQNKTIKNDDCINASYKIDDYSESSCFLFRQMMMSKSQTIRNNKFRKWRGQNLLGAKFKLIIEIFNQYEESNISSMMDIDYIKNKNNDKFVSSVAENNMCSFEIIIDTAQDSNYHRSVINHPIYEYVSYNKNLAINYIDNIQANTSTKDGYNFIVDGSDVPPVNFNAPLRSIINQNTCKFPKTELNNYGYHKNLPLSGQAIATAALISVFGGAIGGFFGGFGITGGLVGGSIAGGVGGIATNMIINWFDTKRKTAMVDAYDDAFYEENYDTDGYGTNDRALVDLSIDGARWYTFDVDIFRYDEACSPIYKPLIMDYKIDNTIDQQVAAKKYEDRALLKTENNSLVFNSIYIPKSELSLRQKNSTFSATSIPQLSFPLENKTDSIKFIDWSNNTNKQVNNIFGPNFNFSDTDGVYFSIDSADAFFILKNRLYPNLVFDTINDTTVSLTVVGCGLFYNPSIGKYSTYISTNNPIIYGSTKLSDILKLYDHIKLYIPTAKNLLAFYKNDFVRPKYSYKAHYQQSLYGEGSWGTGVSYKPIFINSLQFMQDVDLDDFANQLSYYSYNIPYKTLYKNLNNNTYLYKNHNINTKNVLKNKFYTSYNNGYPNNKTDSRDSSIMIPVDDTTTSDEGKILFPTILHKTNPLDGKEIERILSNHFPSSGRAPSSMSASDLLIQIYNIDTLINASNTSLHYDNGQPIKTYEDVIVINNIRDIPSGNTLCVFLTSSADMIGSIKEAMKKALPIAVEGVLDYGDNKYWFNLSKEQKGVFSKLNSVKVLKKITYRCTEVTNSIDLNCINVCGDAPRRDGRDSDQDKPPLPSNYTEKEALKQKTTNRLFNFLSDLGSDPDITFTMPDDTIAEHKADILGTYPAASGIPWREIVVEKPNIRLSCGPDNNVDTILVIKEYYDVLDGGFLKSAQELFDSSNKIRCRFVRWPRKLKGLDQYFDKYILNNNGTYYFNGRNKYTDGMDVKNYFFSWMCSYTNKDKTRPLDFMVPAYYKLLNEVIFRAFYGSSDGAEFKEYGLKTKSEHEWIPYEYENHKQCFSSSVPEKFFRLAVDGVQNLSKFGFLLRCQLYTQFLKFSFSPKNNIIPIQNKMINKCNSYVKANGADQLKSNTRTLPDQKRVQELLQSAEEYESIKKQKGTVPGNHYTSNDVNQIIEIINTYS